jgi:uncharacterized protein
MDQFSGGRSLLFEKQGLEKESAHWYRQAAEQCNRQAGQALGRIYFVGKGVTKDFAEAAKWYRKTSQIESPSEDALENDILWLRKVAGQGHARAQNHLAGLYERGEAGFPQSP